MISHKYRCLRLPNLKNEKLKPFSLVLASTNQHKAAEIGSLLEDLEGIELRLLAEFTDQPIDEPHSTFVENALVKARYGCRVSGLACLADDSGLIVPSLNNEPGIRSARYADPDATDEANRAKLLGALIDKKNRQAFFYCAMALLDYEKQANPFIAMASWAGHITERERGDKGFGYDPIFVPHGEKRTAAEMSADEKNRISHRGLALKQVKEFLSSR